MFNDTKKITLIKKHIYDVLDFKPGIVFKDLSPILLDYKAYKASINLLKKAIKNYKVDAIVGIEARGYWFGIALAQELKIAFIPARKANKLPREKISITYSLEYGQDTVQIHKDDLKNIKNVIVFDDLVATGGTMLAVTKLLRSSNVNVQAGLTLIELTDIGGRKAFEENNLPLISIIEDQEK